MATSSVVPSFAPTAAAAQPTAVAAAAAQPAAKPSTVNIAGNLQLTYWFARKGADGHDVPSLLTGQISHRTAKGDPTLGTVDKWDNVDLDRESALAVSNGAILGTTAPSWWDETTTTSNGEQVPVRRVAFGRVRAEGIDLGGAIHLTAAASDALNGAEADAAVNAVCSRGRQIAAPTPRAKRPAAPTVPTAAAPQQPLVPATFVAA